MFGGGEQDRRAEALSKKREYALQLQQQMQSKQTPQQAKHTPPASARHG